MGLDTCSFCDRKGVLIYPVRYAVACPAGANNAPALTANFKIEKAPQAIATAKYTLRAIRTGYLYTYDEKRDRLKAYLVLPGGHLWNFPHDLPAPNPKEKVFNCISPVESALSMCVDVSHSDKDPARVLWIGWSNTAWTPALIRQVKNDEWRRRHMRGIDIPWMLTGSRDVHVGEFEKDYKAVSHFVMSVKQMQKAFGFSNTPISHEMRRMNMADRFLRAFSMQTPIKKGFIVALDDPVGMANDLSELTLPTEHSGFDAELYRGHIIEEILQSSEAAIRAQARKDFDFKTAQKKFDQQEDNPFGDKVSYSDVQELWDVIRAGGPGKLEQRRKEEQRKYGAGLEAERKAAEDREWTDLVTIDGKPLLDGQKRTAQAERYNSAVKAFEQQGIALAQAHANWLKSEQLSRWMSGVHDASDLASGFAYRESLAQCVGKAAATVVCDQQLSAWLRSADASNVRNLYARAMLFNHDEIIEASMAQIKGGDIKLKNLLNIYKQGLTRLRKGEEMRLVDRMIFTTTNSVLRAFGEHATDAMRNLTLISLTLLGKTVINASNKSPRDFGEWMLSEVRRRKIEMDTDRSETKAGALKVAKKIPGVRPFDPSVCGYEFDHLHVENERQFNTGAIKAIKIPGYETIQKWLGSSADFNLGAVGAILQFVAFGFAYRDFKVGDRFESTKYFGKLAIAVLSLGGGILELAGTAMEKAPSHPLSVAIYEHWAKDSAVGKKIFTLGKRIGLLAGIATALFDVYDAYSAFLENDMCLFTLYTVSAVLGLSLAVASYLSAAVVWSLFIGAFILGIVIAVFKKSALKKWISHCFFASDFSESVGYPSLEEELVELQTALGG